MRVVWNWTQSRWSRLFTAIVAVLFVIGILSGCAGATANSVAPQQETVSLAGEGAGFAAPPSAAMARDESIALDSLMSDDVDFELETEQQPQQQRVILRDANLTIIVDDTTATIDQISVLADELGGWVVNANTNSNTAPNGDTYTTGNVTVRVPAERLDEV
ncbi:MAG: DUF4349 domain-containing protein, partial [Chloroflexota bacterium]